MFANAGTSYTRQLHIYPGRDPDMAWLYMYFWALWPHFRKTKCRDFPEQNCTELHILWPINYQYVNLRKHKLEARIHPLELQALAWWVCFMVQAWHVKSSGGVECDWSSTQVDTHTAIVLVGCHFVLPGPATKHSPKKNLGACYSHIIQQSSKLTWQYSEVLVSETLPPQKSFSLLLENLCTWSRQI